MKKPFAKRSLGQNFLSDPNYVNKIISALDPKSGEMVVEIGPGRGALTEKLVASGADVVAIELDRDLVPLLRERFKTIDTVNIIEADVLEMNFGTLLVETQSSISRAANSTKLVANLPYYISTAILQKLASEKHLFSELILMFQREVVERITAGPGNSDRGFLTVLVESAFDVERLFDIPPDAFRPRPKIWSSVVRLTPNNISIADQNGFRKLVSAGFAQKRKTLINNLKNVIVNAEDKVASLGIDTKARAETLTLDDWLRLSDLK